MDVTLVDSMGSDLSVVNAARVSFAKVHDNFDNDKDTKLINYLAKHNHWSPFGHASMQLMNQLFIILLSEEVRQMTRSKGHRV